MKFPVRIILALAICFVVVVLYQFDTEHQVRKSSLNSVNATMPRANDRLADKSITRGFTLVDFLHRYKENLINSGINSRAAVDICTLDILEILHKKETSTLDVKMGRDSEQMRQEIKTRFGSETDILHVILIPHSHSDAGWVKTLDEYYNDQTRHTLDNMVVKLMKYPNMTFVWAETVFLSMWWKDLNEETRNNVRRLISRQQLEIVGGGWVVPDEANPHYFTLIDQLILGHQWLEKNLNVRPRNTWSLDAFGYSTTLPYLYKRAGFENAVILRVNSYVKKELEERQALEFNWRQTWDVENTTDFRTLMMPYMLYSVKHSCGPNERVCLKFDFRQIPGEIKESRAHVITDDNVMSLAEQLLDQYRRKAALYPHNVVLVPLGDDFRYDKEQEWEQQYVNYQKLFDAMNSRGDWNVSARFGTVQDYFDQVNRVIKSNHKNQAEFFPSLAGDFFPYTDHNNEYWSGYYSTRPFAKGLGRDVEVYLRSADILNTYSLFSLSLRKFDQQSTTKKKTNLNRLTHSRQHMALFQHHDAITGTDKGYVARDYEKRLNEAIQLTKYSIRDAISLFYPQSSDAGMDDVPIRVLDPFSERLLKPSETVIHIPSSGVNLVIFNNLAHDRKELIKLTVDRQMINVIDEYGNPIVTQIIPVWDSVHEEIKDLVEIAFLVDLPALSLVTLRLTTSISQSNSATKQSSIKLYNQNNQKGDSLTSGNVTIENEHIRAVVSLYNGQLIQLILKHKEKDTATSQNINMKLMTYKSSRSGAYIFSPMGPPLEEHFRAKPEITQITGPVLSELLIKHKHVTQIIRIVNTTGFLGGALSVENLVNITKLDDTELIMRLNTDISDGGLFYTDQNGHHSVRRKRFPRFSREANYYPMTSVLYIEDIKRRLSLIAAQPMGGSSQARGSIEVMLDRRLMYDDGRGMGEGVKDNKPVLIKFFILLERSKNEEQSDRHSGCGDCIVAPTLAAHILSERLRNYPILALTTPNDGNPPTMVSLLSKPLPCDVSLVNFRVLGVDSLDTHKIEIGSLHKAVVILHRKEFTQNYEISVGNSECSGSSETVDLETLFRDLPIHRIKESTLSLMSDKRELVKGELVTLKPNEIYALKFTFR